MDWKRDNLLAVEKKVGEYPNHTTARKPGPPTNHSIFSGWSSETVLIERLCAGSITVSVNFSIEACMWSVLSMPHNNFYFSSLLTIYEKRRQTVSHWISSTDILLVFKSCIFGGFHCFVSVTLWLLARSALDGANTHGNNFGREK